MLSDPGAEWEQAKWKGWHVSLSLPRRIHVLACFCSLATLHNRWMAIDWTSADGDGYGVQSNPCFVKGGDVQITFLQLIWRNSQYTMGHRIMFPKNRGIWEFLTFLSRRRAGHRHKSKWQESALHKRSKSFSVVSSISSNLEICWIRCHFYMIWYGM